jgi:hypothetical protein
MNSRRAEQMMMMKDIAALRCHISQQEGRRNNNRKWEVSSDLREVFLFFVPQRARLGPSCRIKRINNKHNNKQSQKQEHDY